jgi:hypothetical protein
VVLPVEGAGGSRNVLNIGDNGLSFGGNTDEQSELGAARAQSV